MKKILLVSCLAMAVLLVISGCSTTNVSKLSGPTVVISKTIVSTPDVEKGDRISGEANITKILWGLFILGDTKYADNVQFSSQIQKQDEGFFAGATMLSSMDSASKAKAAAAYDACNKSGADIILIPNYVVDEKYYFFWSEQYCKVTGFKGIVKGVKEIECKDYLEMQLTNQIKIVK
ncbi:MAG: hypothetical protein WCP55_13655 [Lentisphaerota bacterium]